MKIDWSQVIPGKTVLVWDAEFGYQNSNFLVKAIKGNRVWITNPAFITPTEFTKSDFRNCHIKEEWKEITEQCVLGFYDGMVCVEYEGYVLGFDDTQPEGKFKIGPGLRVFERATT